MPKDVILTPEGLQKLKDELELLSTEKRREVAERIKEARELAAQAIGHWPHQHVRDAVTRHPYQNPTWRQRYGEHLVAAGFPP